ncbi:SDR family oxidoreductase [Candidatus Methylospira mobilis]|uniref:SDR family oxidoreductase n=1 Tax=Candidatus Methylospira mobilis TaxID=1808979 RepID=A0A5Q0BB99_9GAMM|nr:SDR family oxidoreductase [Candidatus Methylospira mobilis]QFY41195.1 SDR family oxidoreductase [Candidatus Methylospira mobilis]
MNTILITGANRGLGLEFCRQYAESGWNVLACCRNHDAADALNTLAARHSGKVQVHAMDVGDFQQIDELASQLADQPIDVLLANAGIYGDKPHTGFGSLDYAQWTQTLLINAQAPVKLAEAFFPNLLRGKLRLIVPITSLMGSMSDNRGGGSLMYRSSKAALNAAMKTLSIDLKPQGVGVLILHPGWVKTDMGGDQAPTYVTESVDGMIRVIRDFTFADTGRFLNFKGVELPW